MFTLTLFLSRQGRGKVEEIRWMHPHPCPQPQGRRKRGKSWFPHPNPFLQRERENRDCFAFARNDKQR